MKLMEIFVDLLLNSSDILSVEMDTNPNPEAELIQQLCRDRAEQNVLLHNLESLLFVIFDLEDQHKMFIKQRLRCLRYGSR